MFHTSSGERCLGPGGRRHCISSQTESCLPALSSKQQHDRGVFGEQCGSIYHRLFLLNIVFVSIILLVVDNIDDWKCFNCCTLCFCWALVWWTVGLLLKVRSLSVCCSNFLKKNQTYGLVQVIEFMPYGLFSHFCILRQCLYMIISYLFITKHVFTGNVLTIVLV